MSNILIITADGCTPELDYAVFRMREEEYKVTIAAPKKRRLHVVLHQQEPGWETTLTGIPKEIHQFWERRLRPLGYKLEVQIVDFPQGMPGDVGISLKWG